MLWRTTSACAKNGFNTFKMLSTRSLNSQAEAPVASTERQIQGIDKEPEMPIINTSVPGPESVKMIGKMNEIQVIEQVKYNASICHIY